jgi:RHS repeat-associated protein
MSSIDERRFSEAQAPRFADLNGDGFLDLLVGADFVFYHHRSFWGGYVTRTTVLRAYLNTGSGFVEAPQFTPPDYFVQSFRDTAATHLLDTGLRVIDLNGDGRADLLRTYRGRLSKENILQAAWINNGNGWTRDDSWAANAPLFIDSNYRASNDPNNHDTGTRIMDVDRDGTPDFVQGFNGPINKRWEIRRDAWRNDRETPDIMDEATNGMGATWSIAYWPSSTWANTNLPKPTPTVVRVITDDGNGSSNQTSYSYTGGTYDGMQKRFLGFAYVKKTLPCAEAVCPFTQTWFSQNPLAQVQPTITTLSNADGTYLTQRFITYSPAVSPPYASLPISDATYQFAGSRSSGVRVRRTYDNYGNIISEINDGDIAIQGDETSSVTNYVVNDREAYIVRRPALLTQYRGDNFAARIAATSYFYDYSDVQFVVPTKGLLTKTQRWLDISNTYVQTRNQYDSFGQLQKTFDENGNSTEFVRQDGINISEIRDALYATDPRHHTSTEWNKLCGAPSASVDMNGSKTSYTYDTFCRPFTTSLPSGEFINTSYAFDAGGLLQVRSETSHTNTWQTAPTPTITSILRRMLMLFSSEPQPASMVAQASTASELWGVTYYDGWGRVRRTEHQGPSNNAIVEQRNYDWRGNVVMQTRPYYDNEQPQWISYTYDARGRRTALVHADKSRVTTVYGLNESIVTNETGCRKKVTTDAQGRITQVQEEINGAWRGLWHNYDALDHLTATADSDGNVWLYSYDSLGRRYQLDDPDLGVWNFGYDNAGRLIWQTDAKHQRTEFSYDALGRLRTKRNSTTASWDYDTARPGYFNVGHKTAERNSDGSTQFDYDVGGDLTGLQYNIDSNTYRFSYSYDPMGRLLTITYPDGDTLGTSDTPIEYDTAGRLQTIPDIAHAITYNANGDMVARSNDNGSTVNNTYSPLRGWLQTTQALHDGNVIHSLQYAYRADGLPQEIKLPGDNRKLTYDTMGRLITASSEVVSESYAYSASGNILQFGKNVFLYPAAGTNHPHAVTSIGNTAYTYDANGNMLAGGGRTIDWDANNRPTRINASYFTYDANGKRIKKTENGQTTIYLGATVEVTNGVFTKYIGVANKVLAKRVGTKTSWLYTDQQGTVQAVEDDHGNITRQTFAPYGSPIGNTADAVGFAGEHADSTGLIYLNSRYYDPAMGRFISPDTIVPTILPIGFNRYSYANNSPTRFVDPTGHYSEDTTEGAANQSIDASDQMSFENQPYYSSEYDIIIEVSRDPVCSSDMGIGAMFDPASNFGLMTWGPYSPYLPIRSDAIQRSYPELHAYALVSGIALISESYVALQASFEAANVVGRLVEAGAIDTSAETLSHVFWSGSGAAKEAASKWAASHGGTTLEMTAIGKQIEASTKGLQGLRWVLEARPQWVNASREFASTASGEVNIFQSSQGVNLTSVWREVEYQTLMSNSDVSSIVYHIVP